MRMLLFFDLPSVSDAEKTSYRHFVRDIKKLGFIMIQESVYTKLAMTAFVSDSIQNQVRQILPPKGKVFIIVVTEKQFQNVRMLLGPNSSEVLDTDERLIEL